MINLVLLKYEIRRLILTKKFFYMILILCVWTVDVLMRLVINGFYYTAPFSQWSYSEFINLFSPILFIILILLCTSIFSESEKSVKNIIYSTPISESKYYIMKGCGVFVVFIITTIIPIVISFVYYAFLFEYTEYQYFILPILLFIIPTSLFIFGLSIFLGKINNKLLYALIPFTFIMGALNLRYLPVWIDVFGNNFVQDYGLHFIMGSDSDVVPYIIPNDFLCSRLVLVALGILLFIFACKPKKCKNK
ncbi:hypothetical protein psyc5s11_28690 [Clostridium gelidum]|uniref:ABC-2 family transporter protein n=1 Tax=Clostridium gelidum TaxID=704125 RepID=A0ABM7TCW7_9CLOT|nr:hypothetical protein [Clostridium gelidum]BCZ46802.1 hypothetical protein psyc5s11_28690 [Clostridium gelidum]